MISALCLTAENTFIYYTYVIILSLIYCTYRMKLICYIFISFFYVMNKNMKKINKIENGFDFDKIQD